LSALDPSEPLAQQNLGDELFLAGDPGAARPCWQRALGLAPADASGLRAALELRLSGRATAELIRASPTL
jgi:cytochrome c-type biogenesis protein CcmH/NrfG